MTDYDGDVWCQERLENPAEDLYLATLFSAPRTRPAVRALAALYVELEAIATRHGDLNVARTKLAWWREELGRLEAGQPAHPVTRALAGTTFAPPVVSMLDVITGMELILLEGRVEDVATARMRAERSLGPFAVLLAAMLQPEKATPGRYAALGEAAGLARQVTSALPEKALEPVAAAAREDLIGAAALAREAPQSMQVMVALAWRRVQRPPRAVSGRREAGLRVLTAWRAARGHLPRGLFRA